ncbi:hypothetical protein [Rhodococcus sp. 06-235-1A]|uniref:hypothetical protein n=1 Tax=Rhodococcus sp. 06-235-1A TaxID=2022508 RepID=UPI001179C1A5|nr:hypothetical protein [Rhodococcus sp. 06-235-1A]
MADPVAAADNWWISLPPERRVGLHRYIAGRQAAAASEGHAPVEGQIALPIRTGTPRRPRKGWLNSDRPID